MASWQHWGAATPLGPLMSCAALSEAMLVDAVCAVFESNGSDLMHLCPSARTVLA
jgi:hypothetical protein